MIGWLIFPIVPVVLEDWYYAFSFYLSVPPDPYDWEAMTWALILGPLLGYGFLAGATLGLADDPDRRGWRSWWSRRSIWVGVGPWIGFLAALAIGLVLYGVGRLIDSLGWTFADVPGTQTIWVVVIVAGFATTAYGWLVVAVAAVRRAARAGERRGAVGRGLATALVFVGTLFGSYWAVTGLWRGYYFDPTILD